MRPICQLTIVVSNAKKKGTTQNAKINEQNIDARYASSGQSTDHVRSGNEISLFSVGKLNWILKMRYRNAKEQNNVHNKKMLHCCTQTPPYHSRKKKTQLEPVRCVHCIMCLYFNEFSFFFLFYSLLFLFFHIFDFILVKLLIFTKRKHVALHVFPLRILPRGLFMQQQICLCFVLRFFDFLFLVIFWVFSVCSFFVAQMSEQRGETTKYLNRTESNRTDPNHPLPCLM